MNVIFDVGDVLLQWDPVSYISAQFPTLPAPVLAEQVFRSESWFALDAGTLDRAQAESIFCAHTGLSPEVVRELLEGMPGSLRPIREMVALLERVNSTAHAVYILSNMPQYVAQQLVAQYPWLNTIDGRLFSYEVRCLKPDPAIYRTLLQRYRLLPQDCLFIDDQQDNLQAAAALGLATVHMPSPTPAAAHAVTAQLEVLLGPTAAR